MKSKIALCFIFNHRYDTNIKKLDKLYGDRFSNIFYIVPFYDGPYSDRIIPVWESSYQFEGYIAQAKEKIYDKSIENYIFCADDIAIAPNVNENNIQDILKINQSCSFIPSIAPICNMYDWIHSSTLVGCEKAFVQKGASYQNEIPTVEKANEIFKEKGIGISKLHNAKTVISAIFALRFKGRFNLGLYVKYLFDNKGKHRYPLAYGDSDFICISRDDINEFARLCGVFAAMNLFVECAIPTAMVLACNEIKNESESQHHFNGNTDMKKYDGKISNLYSQWPKGVFRIHPIKLSKWEE